MKIYRIHSQSGQDHGTWGGASESEALAEMLRDAGYRVTVDTDGDLAFEDAATALICGGLSSWQVVEVAP